MSFLQTISIINKTPPSNYKHVNVSFPRCILSYFYTARVTSTRRYINRERVKIWFPARYTGGVTFALYKYMLCFFPRLRLKLFVYSRVLEV